MTFPQMLLLFVASLLGGTLNAVAGGGSFFVFPSLVFTGMPAIQANATSTVALWPGSLASVAAYRKELSRQNKSLLITLVGSSLIGGILGAILLIKTSQTTFQLLLPYLLLLATLLFAFSGRITARLQKRKIEQSRFTIPTLIGIAISQFIIAIYGGYFGGGIGILMLATLALIGFEDVHAMNGLKTVLASCINGVAVITFVIAQVVIWPQAILMVVGAIIGGYGGAYYARKIEQRWIRLFVLVIGFSLTIYFFVSSYLHPTH